MAGLFQKWFHDEDAARERLEKLRWKDGPVCPHCGVIEGSTKLRRMADAKDDPKNGTKTHGRKGLYQCNSCRSQFTITVNTIFEDSHIPLNKWLLAIHLMCSSKEGISALQLQRELWGEDEETKKVKGSYRTAWFMCHRIRWAMTQSPMVEKLSGIVEADKTYIGGREPGKRGMPNVAAGSKKTPVLALVERGGKVRSFPLERITSKTIQPILQQHIDPKSHLVMDESTLYISSEELFPDRRTVNHKAKEYVRYERDFTSRPTRSNRSSR